MAKAQVKLVKKSSAKKMAAKASKGAPAPISFDIQDNGDATFTVFGVDAAGNQSDISGVATLAVTSDNPSILTVDPPVGMTSAMHAVGPLGSANVGATATWNDGSVGPFSFSLAVTVKTGGPTGIEIVITGVTSH